MTRRLLLLTLSALALLGGSLYPQAPVAAAPVPEGATWTQQWFPSEDGTMLRADVLLPADREETDRHPVILSIGPYFGRNALNGSVASAGPVDRFRDIIEGGNIFERGYAWVQVDSRGFGGSDGCNDFGGRGEQMDTEAAVNWAARQPWSNGRVGMWGKSYDAWTQVMALAENPVGLKAVVIQSPLIEAYRGMWMNGVHYNSGWYLTPSLYTGYDLLPSTPSDPRAEEFLYPAKGTATNPDCYAEKTVFTATQEKSLPYWQERDIVDLAGRSDVPTLWSHGFNDVNTKPDNFLPVFERLEGPKRAWIGWWAHDRGNEVELVGRDGFIEEAMAWFDRYLKGDEDAPEFAPIEVQDQEGTWRTEEQWPPADSKAFTMPLRDASYVDDGEESSGFFSITQPAPYDLRVSGVPRANLNVTTQVPLANAIVQLYDLDADGNGQMISRGAYRLGQSGSVSFDLYPAEYIVREGHRLAVRVSGFDSLYHPIPTQTTVGVAGSTLDIPFLRFIREANLEGGPSTRTSPTTQVDQATVDASGVEMAFPPEMRPGSNGQGPARRR